MNGAKADPPPKISIKPRISSTSMTGASHHFLRCTRKSHKSLRKLIAGFKDGMTAEKRQMIPRSPALEPANTVEIPLPISIEGWGLNPRQGFARADSLRAR